MDSRYYTVSEYIQSKETLEGKLIAIDALIDKLELSLVDVTDSSAFKEYWMDDGQMKVKTVYSSVTDVANGIKSLEQIKNRYLNKLNGRTIVLRSGNL